MPDLFHPGHDLKASEINKIVREVMRLSKGDSTTGADTASGWKSRTLEPELWAQITGVDIPSGRYFWAEVFPLGDGRFEVKQGGRACVDVDVNPAYEVNNSTVSKNAIVRMYPGRNGEWYFGNAVGRTAVVELTTPDCQVINLHFTNGLLTNIT